MLSCLRFRSGRVLHKYPWVGLGWSCWILGWTGLGREIWTHVYLWRDRFACTI